MNDVEREDYLRQAKRNSKKIAARAWEITVNEKTNALEQVASWALMLGLDRVSDAVHNAIYLLEKEKKISRLLVEVLIEEDRLEQEKE